MASSSSKNQPPKARKRVDIAPPSNIKRGSNGSAFTRCHSCDRDIPAATADMHDCKRDAMTKTFLAKSVDVVKESSPSRGKDQPQDKKTQKRKAESGVIGKSKKMSRKSKKEKDPNEPKRPPTAFFLFMDEFRKTFKEANPDAKGVALVAKEGGDKWKAMPEEEKATFVQKAAEMKETYVKAVEAYKLNGKESLENGQHDDAEEKNDESEDAVDENLRSAESANERE